MKIAQINICDNGSTGKIMMDIFSALEKSTEKLAYVSLKYGNAPFVKKIHSRFGYRVHKFLSMYLGLDEFGSYFSTKKVIRALKKFKPDILHLHNIHSNTINYILLFKYIKKYNINTVWTLHDCWAFTGGCAHFDINNCSNWHNAECKNCNFLSSAGMKNKINRTNKLYNMKKSSFTGVKNMQIVTPSKWLANLAKQSFLKEYDITTINNGINLDTFYAQDNHTFDDIIDRNKRIILGVASPFNKKKGYSDFIKLADIIDNNVYQVVLVGLSEEQIANLPNNIVGIKRTNNQRELAELYSIAYVFVNLTYEDNFPTVNIEALSCGTPVICYRTGGAIEMLNKYDSIIIDKGDYAKIIDILDGISQLKTNNTEWLNSVKTTYSSSRMAQDYNNIYKKLSIKRIGND